MGDAEGPVFSVSSLSPGFGFEPAPVPAPVFLPPATVTFFLFPVADFNFSGLPPPPSFRRYYLHYFLLIILLII